MLYSTSTRTTHCWNMENSIPDNAHWTTYFHISLWPGNIKCICPIRWCFVEFMSNSAYISCPAHSVDYNIFISNAIYLGRVTWSSDIERIMSMKPGLWRTVWILQRSPQIITARWAGAAGAPALCAEEAEVKASALQEYCKSPGWNTDV